MFACVYSQSIPDGVSLQDFAYSFSPLVEETAIDTVVLDVEGCELLFGSAYELANEIANRATSPKELSGLGCKVNVAVAANPDAAIHAARCFNGISFIAPGEELTSLGDLPIGSPQGDQPGNPKLAFRKWPAWLVGMSWPRRPGRRRLLS